VEWLVTQQRFQKTRKKNKKINIKRSLRQNQKQTIAQVECTAQGEQFLHHREQNIPVVPKKNQT
jgi:hypothetical protein